MPVLSVHNTVVAPSDSIAEARLVSTLTLDIRHAPIAMKTAITRGNSSGSKDIPSAIPLNIASSQELRKIPYNKIATKPAKAPMIVKLRTKPLNCFCNCGCWLSIIFSAWPILPISLRIPVACAIASPVPRTTKDPAKI